MITCMGLVVGAITSAIRNDVLEKCARFIYTHRYLEDTNVSFEIDGEIYCTLVDTLVSDGFFYMMVLMYDGFTSATRIKLD